MAFNDSTCDCGAQNLTDYPVCPACAARFHFTHRADCRCDSCAPLVIAIRPSQRGTWDFTPPFANEAFLDDFYLRIGKRFRFWNTRTQSWEIKPLDGGMLDLIEGLLRKHFSRYRVVREAAGEAAGNCVGLLDRGNPNSSARAIQADF